MLPSGMWMRQLFLCGMCIIPSRSMPSKMSSQAAPSSWNEASSHAVESSAEVPRDSRMFMTACFACGGLEVGAELTCLNWTGPDDPETEEADEGRLPFCRHVCTASRFDWSSYRREDMPEPENDNSEGRSTRVIPRPGSCRNDLRCNSKPMKAD